MARHWAIDTLRIVRQRWPRRCNLGPRPDRELVQHARPGLVHHILDIGRRHPALPGERPAVGEMIPIENGHRLPTPALTVPTKVPNQPQTIKAVTVTGCSSTSPGWRATSTVINSTSKERAYTITVFFTNASATVVGYGSSKVRVPAPGSGWWTAVDRAAPSTVARCVLRGAATN